LEQNSYIILGVSDNATSAEITAAYEKLKKHYSDQLFLEGEAGNIAAEKLSEVKQAYADALELCKIKNAVKKHGSIHGEIEAIIKAGKIDEAQKMLDNMVSHDAEWHYLQSAVYHARGWSSDAKKQLKLAISIDPENPKYRQAKAQLEIAAGIVRMQRHYQVDMGDISQDGAGGRAGYPPPIEDLEPPSTFEMCCTLCRCCCCLDLCFCGGLGE